MKTCFRGLLFVIVSVFSFAQSTFNAANVETVLRRIGMNEIAVNGCEVRYHSINNEFVAFRLDDIVLTHIDSVSSVHILVRAVLRENRRITSRQIDGLWLTFHSFEAAEEAKLVFDSSKRTCKQPYPNAVLISPSS